MATKPNMARSGCKVGPDQVWFVGERIVIYATREMSDWEVRRHNHLPVYFQGKKFVLREASKATAPHAARYELEPWPTAETSESTFVIHYDEGYVQHREEAVHEEKGAESYRNFIMVAWPFLGFFWSHTKRVVIERHGIDPRTVTIVSLWMEFGAVLAWSIYWSFTGGLGTVFAKPFTGYTFGEWTLSQGLWVLAALLNLWADCVVRYDDILRDEPFPSGLMEWPVRKTRLILGHKC